MGQYDEIANMMKFVEGNGKYPYMLYTKEKMSYGADFAYKSIFSDNQCDNKQKRIRLLCNFIVADRPYSVRTHHQYEDLILINSSTHYLTTIDILANYIGISYDMMYDIIYYPSKFYEINLYDDQGKEVMPYNYKTHTYDISYLMYKTDPRVKEIQKQERLRKKATKVQKEKEENIKKINDQLEDFIYTANDSNKLSVQSSYDSIDEFFKSDFSENASISILCVDTKVPLITITKELKNDREIYKFVVDITSKDEDSFNIKTTFNTPEQFKSLLNTTINALKEYKVFYKYIKDLEKYIN